MEDSDMYIKQGYFGRNENSQHGQRQEGSEKSPKPVRAAVSQRSHRSNPKDGAGPEYGGLFARETEVRS